MTEYMTAVFALCAVISLCSMISFKEKKDFSVRFAFSTLVVYAALMPIVSSHLSFDKEIFFDYEFDAGEYSEDYISVAEDAFCEGIKRLVTEKYGLSGESVFVLAEGFDFESMSADRIRIILSGAAALADYKGIEKYINDFEMGRCSVEIEIG